MEKTKIWIFSHYARRIRLLERAYKAYTLSRHEDFYETIVEFYAMRVIEFSLEGDSFLPHRKSFEVDIEKMLDYLMHRLSIMGEKYILINDEVGLDREFERFYLRGVLDE